MLNRRLPLGSPAAGTDSGTTSPAAVSRPARHLIAVMLIAAAALDLIRCGLVMVAVRHPAPAAGLVTIGLAAAALSVRTARGWRGRQRWPVWTALLIGAASAPQAAVSGFSTPYTIPDTATAVLGVLLAVAVLATAGRTRVPEDNIQSPCVITRDYPMIRDAAASAPVHKEHGAAADAAPSTDGAAPGTRRRLTAPGSSCGRWLSSRPTQAASRPRC